MLNEEKQGVPPQEQEAIKGVSVPSHTMDAEGTVYYIINVQGSFNKWSVQKRYSQFETLAADVLAEMAGKPLPAGAELPPKRIKLFTSHVSPAFIEERRVLLEAYLKKLVSVERLARSNCLTRFLTSDRTETAAETKEDVYELPEDVEITGISIPATRSMSDHVLYQIDVTNSRKRKTFSKWTVLKRFGQFFDMDSALRAGYVDQPDILASLPAPPQRKAKLFNDHMDDTFVEQRRVLLENYLNKLLLNEYAVRDKHFLTFLGVSV